MPTEFQYTLAESFEYAHAGNPEEAQFITMRAPSAKNVAQVAPIKQAFTRAVQDAQQRYAGQETGDEDSELDGQSIMAMIEGAGEDMAVVTAHFQQLFVKSGLFLVDGEEKLTVPLVDSMGIHDFYGLAGDFLKNFIVASLMGKTT